MTTESESELRADSRVRPYHHGNLRAALLEAAVAVIEEQGVGELKLRDLARRVGVSHGAPANHFRDRNALLTAIAIEGFEKLRDAHLAVLEKPHGSPIEALHAVGVAYVGFSVEHRAHFEVMFQRELLADPELQRVALRNFDLLLTAVAKLSGGAHRGVEPGGPARPARSDEPLAALGAWALVHGVATLHAQGLLPGAVCHDVGGLASRILTAMSRIMERSPRDIP